ncbi:hypothetical protein EWM64_g9272 [Hericium alpestre]|uniref:Uncharacterized protein n=1 Tax=Hericium alpestre TaxID=135208 RepID=A0A4Y9ZMJ7_9AGAM|nr:hypothetical protein EWM64_g9272 [Hericium alpestre]
MSYTLNSPTSNGIASGQSGRYFVPPEAFQSAIATHQQPPTRKDIRGDKKLAQCDIEFEAISAAYFRGQATAAEFDAAMQRVAEAGRAYDRRVADFQSRDQAGKTKLSDYFKEFYGYTDEEAEEHLRQGARSTEIRMANQARNQSRVQQRSTFGRGH